MLPMMPRVTLILAGCAALLHLWLATRVGQVRRSEGVSIGDGGNERVVRRMRAHANFTENAPLVLLLVLAIELGVGASPWLWAAAALFLVARVLHAIGMDGWSPGRTIGTTLTFGLEIALAAWAIAIPLVFHAPRLDTAPTELVPAQG